MAAIPERIARAAATLDGAVRDRRAVAQFSGADALTITDAYSVQAALVGLRIARSERPAGVKMGFTSRAKMAQMGVDDMIWGCLTDAMIVEDGGVVSAGAFIHPRAEPEIAFLLKAPLHGRVTPMEALAAVEAVAPAIEIIDSRYANFQFSLEDVVADNCSAAAFVVGPWARPDTDMANLGMIFSVDSRPVSFASSAALLGHPLRSLVAAARLSGESGSSLMTSGAIVLAGAAAEATPLSPGRHVSLEVERLGSVSFSVEA